MTHNQLDGLVAPIALYPDPLISEVLVTSTYPREITMAVQWLNQHRDLTGKALADAAQEELGPQHQGADPVCFGIAASEPG